jgi:hypothetical protein
VQVQYTKAQTHNPETLRLAHETGNIKPGQWILYTGNRGQFHGITRAGVIVIRWQKEWEKFGKRQAKANATHRDFAKRYGSL